jgi:uncharacterized protein (TIGR02588 family)
VKKTMAARSSFAETLELGVGAVSGLVVAGLIGYLAWQGFTGGSRPPELSVRVADAGAGEFGFTVTNDGGHTATDVAVALVLESDGQPTHVQRLVIDYIPGHSQASGSFLLSDEDAARTARLVVEGYVDP